MHMLVCLLTSRGSEKKTVASENTLVCVKAKHRQLCSLKNNFAFCHISVMRLGVNVVNRNDRC
jgi:hypothetical protein